MKTFENKYRLIVASTPIGNISEVSYRLIEAFETATIILCEDTRVAKKLFGLLEINNKPQFIRYDKFNENQKADQIIDLITNNNKIVLISDAGYPLISDPGYPLIRICKKNGIAIEVINGPNSILHALIISGFSTNEFIFLGFIGKSKSERIKKLKQFQSINCTIIIFESVHRLNDCLKDIYHIYGNIEIAICRELTKIHEEVIKDKISNLLNQDIILKGEFVLVLDKTNTSLNQELYPDENEIKSLINKKMKTKDISIYLSNKYNINQKEIYNHVIKIKNG